MDFNRYTAKLGFTKTETRVILLLVFSFLTGIIYSKITGGGSAYKNFDYSKQDSLFYAAYTEEDADDDYKAEFIDTSKSFDRKPAKVVAKESSIDINQAGINELMMLPGIGEKTAQNIIDYKNKNGNFRSVQDILNVKGIGEVKLAKIKKYIYIQ